MDQKSSSLPIKLVDFAIVFIDYSSLFLKTAQSGTEACSVPLGSFRKNMVSKGVEESMLLMPHVNINAGQANL